MTSKKGNDASSTKWSKRNTILATLGFLIAAFTGYVLYLNNLPDISVFHKISEGESGQIYSTVTVENTGGRVQDINFHVRAGLVMHYTHPSGDNLRTVILLKGHFYRPYPTGLSKGIIYRTVAEASHASRILQVSNEVETAELPFKLNIAATPYVKVVYRDILGFSRTQYYFGTNGQLQSGGENMWKLWDSAQATDTLHPIGIGIEDLTLDNLKKFHAEVFEKATKDHN